MTDFPDLEGCKMVDRNGQLVGDAQVVLSVFLKDAHMTIDELKDTNNNLHKELEMKLRTIGLLRKDNSKKVRENKHYEDAMEVLEYWRKLCHPGATELEGDRVNNVIARLSGRPKPYTKEMLKRCVEGYSHFPYLIDARRRPHGRPAQRRIDAELIFRDPKHVDQGLALADQDDDFQQVLVEGPRTPPSSSSSVALSELGEKALAYVGHGWHVFPCQVDAKQPATIHGLLDAKSDPDAIRAYWSKVPNANIAVRTGAESGIVVLDVDGEDGVESLRRLEAENEKLPLTASIKTPRGGSHFYFAHPEVEVKNTQGVPGLGLDIRGDGGYVLAPPSTVDGRRYEVDERTGIAPMPQWLIKLLLNYQATVSSLDPAAWEELVMKGVKEGARDGQLTRLAGKLLYLGLDSGFTLGLLLAVNEQRCSPPLPPRQVQKIVDSILRREARKALQSVS